MNDAIEITVNGEPREVPSGTTVEALVSMLELPRERVAVELNRAVLRRAEWPAATLAPGDVLEVVHFVGGG